MKFILLSLLSTTFVFGQTYKVVDVTPIFHTEKECSTIEEKKDIFAGKITTTCREIKTLTGFKNYFLFNGKLLWIRSTNPLDTVKY